MNTDSVTNTVVQWAQQWISLLERIYDSPFVSKLIGLLIAIALSMILIFFSRIIAVFVRIRLSRLFVNKDGDWHKKMWVLIWDIVFYAMWFLSIYISFNVVWIDIGLLMWWITIWVWFAFRQTLSNMISGIMIFSTDEYKIWNIVELEEVKLANKIIIWVIEEINMKNIIIRTFDMRRVVMANTVFLKKAIKTYSEEEFIRMEFEVNVDANTEIENSMQATLNLVNTYDFVVNKQYTQVLLDSFDDKKAKLKIMFYFNPKAWWPSESLKSAIQTKLLIMYKNLGKKPEKQIA